MSKEIRVPKEYVSSFTEWFGSQKLECFDKYCKKIYDGISKPKLFKNNPSDFYPDWQSPAYVFILPEGYVLGENGAILTSDNKLIWDLSIEWISSPSEHSIFQRHILPQVKRFKKTVAVVAAIGSNNYYHWMFDILPRFDLVRKSNIEIDYYVVNQCNFSYQTDTLDLLRIPKEKIIQSSTDMFIQSKNLVVPSLPGYTTKWASDFLRQYFLPLVENETSPYGERIYITRNDANSRRVVNEEEIINFLKNHGFTIVCLQNLSVLEQINMFSKAKYIISPHGAGLTNLTFCQPGTKVIEFFSPNYLNPCYWHLSTFLDLQYHPLIGTGISPKGLLNNSLYWSGAEDIRIEIEQFRELFTALI
ncbi:glycosyltransferase family 61 protein [Robertmurraya korlensis]|uniref:glycosyltransferase family 61 protein n=1 Tax=Robertmurraya korlensis TaxID=519977 RepID=UPI0020420283|nr:glycosyltransferase family 61 protein [Robertmurraya korlensis]MCM3603367.1 glycosyltransferase family 61 protein [Robertmurraya korlensis]